jgi:hypothetical protein
MLSRNTESIQKKKEELDLVNKQMDVERLGLKRKESMKELESKNKLLSDLKNAEDAMRKNLRVKLSEVKDISEKM